MPLVTLRNVEEIMVTKDRQESNKEDSDNEKLTVSPPSVYDSVEATVKYSSYVDRQHRDMESWRKAQGMRIPPDLIYEHEIFPTFSNEELERLDSIRPRSFAEASKISGMTPQSLVYLYHHVTKRNRKRDQRAKTANSLQK